MTEKTGAVSRPAGPRVASVRERLAEWSARAPESAGNPAAVVKLYFLILMGSTHIDALSSVEVLQEDLESILDRLTRCLITPDH
jgi:hypothetical protein